MLIDYVFLQVMVFLGRAMVESEERVSYINAIKSAARAWAQHEFGQTDMLLSTPSPRKRVRPAASQSVAREDGCINELKLSL